MSMESQVDDQIGIITLMNGVEVLDGAKSQTKGTPN